MFFFIERAGAIKYLDAKTKAVRVLGAIPNLETGGVPLTNPGLPLSPHNPSQPHLTIYRLKKYRDFHPSRGPKALEAPILLMRRVA